MAKRRSEEVSGGTVAEDEYYTFFIDTSLDTHLATIISDSATVSDVKKKIVLEHTRLFPSIGEIKILSLQVKRQGHFYHLPDSMLVVNAYEGSKRHKSLFVEASASEHDKEKDTCEPEIKGRSSSGTSDHDIVGIETTLDHDGQSIPTMKKRQKETSQDLVETLSSDTNARPGVLRTSAFVPAADRSHMLLPREEVAVDPTAELGVNSGTSPRKHQSTNMEDLASPIITGFHDKNKVSIQPQSQSIHLDTLDSVAIHIDEDGQKGLALNDDCQVLPSGSYKPSDQSDADRTYNKSIVGHKVLETDTSMGTLISDGTKKKRAKKISSVVQIDSAGKQSKASGPNSSAVPNLDAENLVSDNTDKNNSILHQTESDKSNLVEVEKGLSANEAEEKLPECFKPAGFGEAEVGNKGVIVSSHPIDAMEAVHSTGSKRKKRKTRESAAKIQDKMNMENQLNTVSGISLVQDVAAHNQMTGNNKKSESDLHSTESGQTAKIAGDNGESLKQSKTIIPTGSKPIELGNTNVNTNDSVTTIMMSDAKDLKTGSKRKKRRTKKSTEMEQTNTKNDLANVTDRPVDVVVDEAMNAQKILAVDVRKKDSESVDVSASGIQREGEKVIQNEEGLLPHTEVHQNQENNEEMDDNVKEVVKNNPSRDDNGSASEDPVKGQPDVVQDPIPEQSGRHQENNSNVNRKEKKKRKKGQIYAAESVSNLETKKHKVGVEELAVSGDILKGMDGTSKTAKIRKPTDGETAIQSNVPSFEIQKNAGTELGCSTPEPAQIGATSLEVPLKGRPETQINDQSDLETAKCEDEEINFRHYFVLGLPQNEVGSLVKVKEASQSMKSKKKKDKSNAVTETTLKLSETNGKGNPSDGKNVNDNKLEESTKKQNEELQMANKKTSIASQDGVKAPTSSDVAGNRTLKKAIKPAVANGSQGSRAVPARWEEKNGSSTAPGLSSRSKGSGKVQSATNAKQQPRFNHNAMSTRKDSSNENLLKSSGQEKNLLTTERKLFTSSGNSDDEKKMSNSDSSTRSPSDDSSSSDSSSGESDSSQDSKRKGSEDTKTKAGAGKNISSKKFSGLQYMSMDEVLKSSSRFKKAKLTASQSQDGDTENWPDDIVPDSQANV